MTFDPHSKDHKRHLARARVPWERRNVRRSRLSRTEYSELKEYVRQYKDRRVMGVWEQLADAIEVALREIDKARARKKRGAR